MGHNAFWTILIATVVTPQVLIAGRPSSVDDLDGHPHENVANANTPASSDASAVCSSIDMAQRHMTLSSFMQISRHSSSSPPTQPSTSFVEVMPHVNLAQLSPNFTEHNGRDSGTSSGEVNLRETLARRFQGSLATNALGLSISNGALGAMIARSGSGRNMFVIFVFVIFLLTFGLALTWAYFEHCVTADSAHRAVSRNADIHLSSKKKYSSSQIQVSGRNVSADIPASNRDTPLRSSLHRGVNFRGMISGDTFRGTTTIPHQHCEGSSPYLTPREELGASDSASTTARAMHIASNAGGTRGARWMLCQDLLVPKDSECTLLVADASEFNSSRERQIWPLLNEHREQILEFSVEIDRAHARRKISYCLKLSSPSGILFASARTSEHGLEVFDARGGLNGFFTKDASSIGADTYAFQSNETGEKIFLDGSKRSRRILMETFDKEPVATMEPHDPANGADGSPSSVITVAPYMDAGLAVLCVLGMRWLQGGVGRQWNRAQVESPVSAPI